MANFAKNVGVNDSDSRASNDANGAGSSKQSTADSTRERVSSATPLLAVNSSSGDVSFETGASSSTSVRSVAKSNTSKPTLSTMFRQGLPKSEREAPVQSPPNPDGSSRKRRQVSVDELRSQLFTESLKRTELLELQIVLTKKVLEDPNLSRSAVFFPPLAPSSSLLQQQMAFNSQQEGGLLLNSAAFTDMDSGAVSYRAVNDGTF